MFKFVFYIFLIISIGSYVKGYFIQNSIEKLSLRIEKFESNVNRLYAGPKTMDQCGKLLTKNYNLFGGNKENSASTILLSEKILKKLSQNKVSSLFMIQFAYLKSKGINHSDYLILQKLIKEGPFVSTDDLLDFIHENLEINPKDHLFIKSRLTSTLIECLQSLFSSKVDKKTVQDSVNIWIKTNHTILIKSKNRNKMEIYYNKLVNSIFINFLVRKLVTF